MKFIAIASIDKDNIPSSKVDDITITKPHSRPYLINFNGKWASVEYNFFNTEQDFIKKNYSNQYDHKSIVMPSFDEFMHQLGFVLSANIINDEELIPLFKKAYDLISENKVKIHPEINYIFNDPQDVLTREVLTENPQCSEYEFRRFAFDKYLELGLPKQAFIDAVNQYS